MISVMSREFLEAVCCCGHQRVDHEHLGEGYCILCKASCPKFHKTGEGHGMAPKIVLGILSLFLTYGLWQLVTTVEKYFKG